MRVKQFLSLLLIILATSATIAQTEKTTPTRSFTISGEVKAPVTIQVSDLSKWTAATIGDVTISNHLGEPKGQSKGMKGVLLKDVLGSVEINAESPKALSEYYFVCKANDNYTVVYSWNELFNTATGDSAYIVTEKEGKPASAMDDSILMLSSKDFKTGRRQLKSLSVIEVKRAR
jgi:hypothetical protein